MNGLQYIREQFNMSIAALARRMGISYQAVSQWEKGIRQIPAKRLNELSAIFGIPAQYFADIEESDIEELGTLFFEYNNILKAKQCIISKIDCYLTGKESRQKSFQELTDVMKIRVKLFENLLDDLVEKNRWGGDKLD